MIKRLIVAALAATLLMPAAAEARGFLSKYEAQHYANKNVRELADDLDADYWLERASRCFRWNRMRVECDFQIQHDDGINCDDAIVIQLYRDNTYTARYPYEPECF